MARARRQSHAPAVPWLNPQRSSRSPTYGTMALSKRYLHSSPADSTYDPHRNWEESVMGVEGWATSKQHYGSKWANSDLQPPWAACVVRAWRPQLRRMPKQEWPMTASSTPDVAFWSAPTRAQRPGPARRATLAPPTRARSRSGRSVSGSVAPTGPRSAFYGQFAIAHRTSAGTVFESMPLDNAPAI